MRKMNIINDLEILLTLTPDLFINKTANLREIVKIYAVRRNCIIPSLALHYKAMSHSLH